MQPFIVKLTGLKPGITHFDRHIGREFFDFFDNSDIIDADIVADVQLNFRGLTADVHCQLSGKLVVSCDRCWEELELKIETSFDESYAPEGMELDLSQEIYDYICLSLPLQRTHPEGECNSETTKYLSNNI